MPVLLPTGEHEVSYCNVHFEICDGLGHGTIQSWAFSWAHQYHASRTAPLQTLAGVEWALGTRSVNDVVLTQVLAVDANLTVPVGSTATFGFKYVHPEPEKEEYVWKTIFSLQEGRNNFCETANQITVCHGKFRDRAVIEDNEEEGLLTLTLPDVQRSDEGWYEAEVRVKFHPHGTPANVKTFLRVTDAPTCRALICPGSNMFICRMETRGNLPTCTCECADGTEKTTSWGTTVFGFIVLGMTLVGLPLCILLPVVISKGWVVINRPQGIGCDAVLFPRCPTWQGARSVNLTSDDEDNGDKEDLDL
ncbi:uncharacterized protein [Branchiostoma lanceolatum]|uniref:uncharacterized protein n=1 Tax=Branchiostoma lanceolatum TaxID=7740 RepID=UPI0034551B39